MSIPVGTIFQKDFLMAIEDSFSDRLAKIREERGLSQDAMGQLVGVPAFTVSRWESGSRKPTWESVVQICKALGVTADVFHTPVKNPAAKPKAGRPKKEPAPKDEKPKRSRKKKGEK